MKGFVVDVDEGPPHSRPPSFAECYVCKKQFGSHSIALHEPRCLERWRAANSALPTAKRAATPRPRTTTLSRPKVLDADKCTEVDMSTRRCSELLALASLSSRSGGESSSSPDSEQAERSGRRARPGTMRLAVGPRDLNVPNIEYRARTAVLSPERSRLRRASDNSRSSPARPPHGARLPSPCVSCGKSENPERFHSHPEEASRSPARARRLVKKRLSIQRPTPVRYKPQPSLDPVAQRKQQQRQEKRRKEARLQEDEVQQERRREALQHNLALTLARYQRPALGPTFIVCYVCGRQFGPTSMPIHQPQCLERWYKSTAALPRRKQGPAPQPPDELPEGATLEEYNQLATDEAQRVKGEKRRASVANPTESDKAKSEESLFFIQF
ncbi:zinc finger protein 474-like [Pollicipes pollicipes]|uniref:zinc finger protein 474-like n=1 Tax=Pollicipes pollicipes TaxID=41117 RepID=UPI001884D1E2|nr:zinc finger protein 474-like [Pollicipes pollicipes]